MLPGAALYVAGNADIKNAVRFVGHDVKPRIGHAGRLACVDGRDKPGHDIQYYARWWPMKLGVMAGLVPAIHVFETASVGVRDPDRHPVSRGPATVPSRGGRRLQRVGEVDRKSTRLNSSHVKISYAVFCSKKKRTKSDVLL